MQVHTYSLYTYICSPFEVLEKGRHALHSPLASPSLGARCCNFHPAPQANAFTLILIQIKESSVVEPPKQRTLLWAKISIPKDFSFMGCIGTGVTDSSLKPFNCPKSSCSIDPRLVDDNRCDCPDCADETNWTCATCSCPTICGVSLYQCDGTGTFACPKKDPQDEVCNLPGSLRNDGICHCPGTCADEEGLLPFLFWPFDCDVCRCPQACGQDLFASLYVSNLLLQPKSDRLQPKSDGLQPKSDGLQPESDGLQPKSDGLQPKFYGIQPKSDGLQPESDGLQPKSDGLQPKSDGLQPKSDGLQPKSDGLQPKSERWPPT